MLETHKNVRKSCFWCTWFDPQCRRLSDGDKSAALFDGESALTIRNCLFLAPSSPNRSSKQGRFSASAPGGALSVQFLGV